MKSVILILIVLLVSIVGFAQESELSQAIRTINMYLESDQLEAQAAQHLLEIIKTQIIELENKDEEIAKLETELEKFNPNDSTTIQEQAMKIERLESKNETLTSENNYLLSNNQIMAESLFEIRDIHLDFMMVYLPSCEYFMDEILETIDEGLAKRIEVE